MLRSKAKLLSIGRYLMLRWHRAQEMKNVAEETLRTLAKGEYNYA